MEENDLASAFLKAQIASTARGRLQDPTMSLGTDPRLHPALLKALQSFGDAATQNAPPPPFDPKTATLEQIGAWIAEYSAMMEELLKASFNNFPIPPPPSGGNFPEILHETKDIRGVDGNTITLQIYRPANVAEGTKLPALVYFHGGGMVFLDLKVLVIERWIKYLAAYGGFVVIAVDFRNAWTPKKWIPFPAGLNDCVSGIQWVHAHKKELGVGKIVLTGESGGGNAEEYEALGKGL